MYAITFRGIPRWNFLQHKVHQQGCFLQISSNSWTESLNVNFQMFPKKLGKFGWVYPYKMFQICCIPLKVQNELHNKLKWRWLLLTVCVVNIPHYCSLPTRDKNDWALASKHKKQETIFSQQCLLVFYTQAFLRYSQLVLHTWSGLGTQSNYYRHSLICPIWVYFILVNSFELPTVTQVHVFSSIQ